MQQSNRREKESKNRLNAKNMKKTTIAVTQAQTKYIESLLKRIKRAGGTSYDKLAWLRENYKTLSVTDASGWIDTLREIIRAHNEISARYAINGRGKQI